MARIDHERYALEDDALWFGGVAAGQGAGRNNIYGTSGDDRLHGTSGGDNFRVDQGGDDILHGGAGDDKFFFADSYTDKDIVYGGYGIDRLILDGTTDTHLTLGPDNLRGIEAIKLTGGTNYDVTVLDAVADFRVKVTSGVTQLSFDGSALTSNVRVFSGQNADTLVGGAGDDLLYGSSGSDDLTGGLGRDTFKYIYSIESTTNFSQIPDTIEDFSQGDRIVLPTTTVGVVQYHVGSTPGHVGDVLTSYDSGNDRTVLNIFTNGDDTADMTIYLVGNITQFEIHGAAAVVI